MARLSENELDGELTLRSEPADALLLVACVAAIGTPDCSVRIPLNVQSFTIAPSTPDIRVRRLAPTGISHTADATKTCGISPVE